MIFGPGGLHWPSDFILGIEIDLSSTQFEIKTRTCIEPVYTYDKSSLRQNSCSDAKAVYNSFPTCLHL
jgi:hypothetical protein